MSLLRDYRQYWLELRFKNGDRWQGGEYVFVKDDGSVIHPDSLTAYLRKFSAKHPELPHINPHAFRHTVASVLINSGQDIVTVSRRLGHSRTSTTLDVYSHLIAEADADASEVIADALLRRRARKKRLQFSGKRELQPQFFDVVHEMFTKSLSYRNLFRKSKTRKPS